VSLVVIETAELARLVRESVREEVAVLAKGATVPEIMDLNEAAKFVRRSRQVLMLLVKQGSVPAHFISDREPRFKRVELLAWLDTLPSQAKETG
jgi:hypothetical protein